MRQTAEKAVSFAKSGAKPQRESEKNNKNKKHRETLGKNRRYHPAQSRVCYHSEVRTPIATAMFGEKVTWTMNLKIIPWKHPKHHRNTFACNV